MGTPGFMAPEVVQGRIYNTISDIYSIGMTAENMFYKIEELIL